MDLRQVAARPRRRRQGRGRRAGPPQAGRLRARRPHGADRRHAGHDHRQQGAGGRRAGAAHRHLAGVRRRPVRRQRRRGGGARRQEGRRAGHGELPDLRPQGLRRRDQREGVQEAVRRRAPTYPLFNRAIQESKAVGSTFKPVTAVAGLEEGVITPGTTEWCPGSYTSPDDYAEPPQKFKCWATDGHGNLDLVGAITQSCDVYFYNVGNTFYERKGTALEDWAVRFGMGKTTGIDIPGESTGRVPTPDWKKKHFETEIDQQWTPGDSILLAVGQGNLEATPLQLATRVRGDRQRRQGRDAASGTQGGRRRRADRARPRADDHPQGRHLADHARDGPPGPLPGRAQPGRHVGADLLRLQGRRLRQDGDGGGLGRQRASTTSTTPGTRATRRPTTRSTPWSS